MNLPVPTPTLALVQKSSKAELVREYVNRRIRRFPHLFDATLHEESSRCLALCGQEFLKRRDSGHIVRMVSSQRRIRKMLLQSLSSSGKRLAEVRFLPTTLSFPFASKPVLGLMIGVTLKDHYELFTEEHALRAIRRLDPQAEMVKGTLYHDLLPNEKIKIIYLELEKPLSAGFQKSLLEKEIQQSIEKARPSVFMQNSEEDVLKNILILSQQISAPSDLPQAMIHLEEQSTATAAFKVILLYVARNDSLPFDKLFQEKKGIVYRPERMKTVRYLNRTYPVQAAVFHLHIPKTADLLRPDASLNFHAARQKISDILHEALGEFRDYNGGLISRQQDTFAQIKELFKGYPQDLLESFFYSISPLENQATISLETASALLGLALKSMEKLLASRADYCLLSEENGMQTFAVFRAGESAFQEFLAPALQEWNISHESLTTAQFSTHDSFIMGFILDHHSEVPHALLAQALQSAANQWAEKIDRLQVLRFALEFSPYSLDPRIGGDDNSKIVLRFLFDGLMRIGPKGQVIPGAAESVEISPDGTRYLFKLRQSRWSNGDLVSASDFEYAWKTVLSPDFKTPFAYFFYPIKNAQAVKEGRLPADGLGVKAIDKTTLSVELEFPVPYFLELAAHPMFAPVNARIDRLCPAWPTQDDGEYVCNGAFLLKKSSPPYGYMLVKNLSYWDVSQIHLDQVKIIEANQVAALQMFQKNELDWIGFPLKINRAASLDPATDKTVFLTNESVTWYVFNTQSFPFDNRKLRQAFALALNRAELVRSFSGTTWPAFTPLPLSHSRAVLMDEDKGAALQLFEEALRELGLDRSTFPPLWIVCAKEANRERMSKLAAQTWEEIFGIRCQVEGLESSVAWNRMIEGEFHISLIFWVAMIDDPSYTLACFRDSAAGINLSKWENEEYCALFDRAQQERNTERRLDYFAQAEEVLIREVPIIPVLRVLYASVQKKTVSITNHSTLKYWDLKWASVVKKKETL